MSIDHIDDNLPEDQENGLPLGFDQMDHIDSAGESNQQQDLDENQGESDLPGLADFEDKQDLNSENNSAQYQDTEEPRSELENPNNLDGEDDQIPNDSSNFANNIEGDDDLLADFLGKDDDNQSENDLGQVNYDADQQIDNQEDQENQEVDQDESTAPETTEPSNDNDGTGVPEASETEVKEENSDQDVDMDDVNGKSVDEKQSEVNDLDASTNDEQEEKKDEEEIDRDIDMSETAEVPVKTESSPQDKTESETKVAKQEDDSEDVPGTTTTNVSNDNTNISTPSLASATSGGRLDEDEVEDFEEEEEPKSTIKQTHVIIIPSYASWFNMRKVHQIEQESLPEFFKTSHPSKSPKIYVNYRNFMINAYRLNPNEYLTLTSCRRNLVGDVGTLMRVHRFLNKWGLINYQVRPQFKPGYAVEKLPNGQLVGLPYTGDYNVKYDTPRGLFPFDTFKGSLDKIDIPKLKKLLNIEESVSVSTGSNNDTSNGSSSPDKKRPSSSSLEDGPALKKQDGGWTEEEVSKLILGIKKYKNDWFKIAEEIGNNKTPQQCILKFLQVPIEDKFNPFDKNTDGGIFKLLKYAPNFPVSASDNPVLSNLAFMTQLVDSDVAKAASSRASKVMDEKIAEKVSSIYGKKLESEKPSEEEELKTEQVGQKTEESKDEAMEEDNDIVKEESEEKKQDDEADDESKRSTDVTSSPKQNGSHKDSLVEAESHEAKENSPVENIKEAVTNTLGIVGARSHLFATYEEREMHKLSTTIINHELSKIDLKLSKVEELEKIYEHERKHLAKQQEEVFIDRLALTKSTIDITKKLDDAISMIEDSVKSDNSKFSSISSLLAEAKSLLYKPTRHSLTNVSADAANGDINEHSSSVEPTDSSAAANNDDDFKPLSLKTPQAFKVWAP
ncbi:uncharacterized protein CANTADRAFT_5528 [Suhomyces tanzawaensis NRRL Y-17324]|uniref:SWIRM-domain-containing protein n=1 Tax=Suhomyces tanzawaensis NRRL Y-17324 TaxID=984487 RepID=A0A1E4SJZ3_9ASCO|nr:uncharacterized protein CANTADRAFT_5528 [Suhomyces tanzawaensis NRRL Y-17324]ODV79823.1 hypothetical protein CANTADRAFT_5528 [Suhomyces tanzawaensis NRRL Y-17324]